MGLGAMPNHVTHVCRSSFQASLATLSHITDWLYLLRTYCGLDGTVSPSNPTGAGVPKSQLSVQDNDWHNLPPNHSPRMRFQSGARFIRQEDPAKRLPAESRQVGLATESRLKVPRIRVDYVAGAVIPQAETSRPLSAAGTRAVDTQRKGETC
jgi:hypothetical protein